MKRLFLALIFSLLMVSLAFPASYYPAGSNNEQLTVSTSAVGFTQTKIDDGKGNTAISAVCCVETNPVRWFTSSIPTAALGLPVSPGSCFTIEGGRDILSFRMIEANTATGTATVTCQYSM